MFRGLTDIVGGLTPPVDLINKSANSTVQNIIATVIFIIALSLMGLGLIFSYMLRKESQKTKEDKKQRWYFIIS